MRNSKLSMIALGVLFAIYLLFSVSLDPLSYGHHNSNHNNCNPNVGVFDFNFRCIAQLANYLSLTAPSDISCDFSVEIDIVHRQAPVIRRETRCDNLLRFVSNSDLEMYVSKEDLTIPSSPASQAILDALGLFIIRDESHCEFYNPAGRRINRNPRVSLAKVLRDAPSNDLWFDPDGPVIQNLVLLNKPGRAGIFDCSFKLDFFLDPDQIVAISAGTYTLRMNFLSSPDGDEGCDEDSDDAESDCNSNQNSPTANDDFASTVINQDVDVDVMENDFDLIDFDDLYIISQPTLLSPGTGIVTCDIDVPKSSGGQCYFSPAPGFEGNAYFSYDIADRPSSNSTGLTDTATATINVGSNVDVLFWDGTVDGNVTNDPQFVDDDFFTAFVDGQAVATGVGTNATPLRVGLTLNPGWHDINFCWVEESPFDGRLGVLSYKVIDKTTGSILRSGFGIQTPTIDDEDELPICFDSFSSSYPRSFYLPDHD